MNAMNQATRLTRITRLTHLALCLTLAAGAGFSACSTAAELTVNVTGLTAPYGSVGCSLFSTETGFPMDNAHAKSEWVSVSGDTAVCKFKDLSAGRFAVSVAHDTNGNKKLDTNLFGIPTEQWGVSNNVRPALRAPKYEEAAFNIPADVPNLSIEIRVSK